MDAIAYRDARPADAGPLAELFAATFVEVFGHLYRSEDLAAFLAQHQPQRLAPEIANAAYAIRLAEIGGRLGGYLKLGPLKLPVEDEGLPGEIHQLYLAPAARGSGMAAELMDWALDEARMRGMRALYLSVYTGNDRARAFYSRYGFEEVGPYAFMVGEQADEDLIMKLSL